ncbi:alpha/beta fold hydrolase [Glycocaulis profundi]|nr:alpha/beta fold hydrolase [Glycocaulis profundi]
MKHAAINWREDAIVLRHAAQFAASDGRVLNGTLFTPEQPMAVMAVNAATGLTQDFYQPFAQAAARHGWAALIYDPRGAGASRDVAAKDDPATLIERGTLDLEAAARFLKARHPGLPLDLVGHSSGGHFAALLPDDLPVRKMALLASSDGYWGRHAFPKRFKIWWFWNVVGQMDIATKGCVAKSSVWKGDDLPPGVWRQWREWGLNPRYYRDFLEERGLLEAFSRFSAPIRAWVAEDDAIATPRGVRWLLEHYSGSPTEMRMVRPRDVGAGRVGHQGLFYPCMETAFWPQVFGWLSRERAD